jgi:hypothetical protein
MARDRREIEKQWGFLGVVRRGRMFGESEDSNVDVPFGVIERVMTELYERMG